MEGCPNAQLTAWQKRLLRRSNKVPEAKSFDEAAYVASALKSASLEDYLESLTPKGEPMDSHWLEVVARVMKKDGATQQQQYGLWQTYFKKACQEGRAGVLMGVYMAWVPDKAQLQNYGDDIRAQVEHGMAISSLMRPWRDLKLTVQIPGLDENSPLFKWLSPKNSSVAWDVSAMVDAVKDIEEMGCKLGCLRALKDLMAGLDEKGQLRRGHDKNMKAVMARDSLKISSMFEQSNEPLEALDTLSRCFLRSTIRVSQEQQQLKQAAYEQGGRIVGNYQNYDDANRLGLADHLFWLRVGKEYIKGRDDAGRVFEAMDYLRNERCQLDTQERERREREAAVDAIKCKAFGGGEQNDRPNKEIPYAAPGESRLGMDMYWDLGKWVKLNKLCGWGIVSKDPGLARAWEMFKQAEEKTDKEKWTTYLRVAFEYRMPDDVCVEFAQKAWDLRHKLQLQTLKGGAWVGMDEYDYWEDKQTGRNYLSFGEINSLAGMLPPKMVLGSIGVQVLKNREDFVALLGAKDNLMDVKPSDINAVHTALGRNKNMIRSLMGFREWVGNKSLEALYRRNGKVLKIAEEADEKRSEIGKLRGVLKHNRRKESLVALGFAQRSLGADCWESLSRKLNRLAQQQRKREAQKGIML